MTTKPPSKPMGFAAMTPERRREIAAMGGRATPPEKRSFATNNKLAISAGRAGGKMPKKGGKSGGLS